MPASLFQLLDFLCPIDNTPSACLVHVNCVAKRPPILCVITSAANLHISIAQTLPSSQNSFKIANFAAKGIISCLFLRQLAFSAKVSAFNLPPLPTTFIKIYKYGLSASNISSLSLPLQERRCNSNKSKLSSEAYCYWTQLISWQYFPA